MSTRGTQSVHKLSSRCPDTMATLSTNVETEFVWVHKVSSHKFAAQPLVFKQCSNNVHLLPIQYPFSVHCNVQQCPSVLTSILYLPQTFVGPLVTSGQGVQTKDTESRTQELTIRLQLPLLVANSADLLRAHGQLGSPTVSVSEHWTSSLTTFLPFPSFFNLFLSFSRFFNLGQKDKKTHKQITTKTQRSK